MVARPSVLIEGYVSNYSADTVRNVYVALRLTTVFAFNLVLYAVPLTLAGFGANTQAAAPAALERYLGAVVADPDATYQFLVSLSQNSAFLFVAAGLTFVTYHLGVWFTRSSSGFLQSLHTVVYSTGIYLAAIFTLVWYVSQAGSIVVADELLLNLQKEFIYAFIDLFGSALALPSGRPEHVAAVGLTTQGKLALGGIVLSAGYYLYALYLGARINHRASRFSSLLAVAFVTISPALYVSGSIILATTQLQLIP